PEAAKGSRASTTSWSSGTEASPRSDAGGSCRPRFLPFLLLPLPLIINSLNRPPAAADRTRGSSGTAAVHNSSFVHLGEVVFSDCSAVCHRARGSEPRFSGERAVHALLAY